MRVTGSCCDMLALNLSDFVAHANHERDALKDYEIVIKIFFLRIKKSQLFRAGLKVSQLFGESS